MFVSESKEQPFSNFGVTIKFLITILSQKSSLGSIQSSVKIAKTCLGEYRLEKIWRITPITYEIVGCVFDNNFSWLILKSWGESEIFRELLSFIAAYHSRHRHIFIFNCIMHKYIYFF